MTSEVLHQIHVLSQDLDAGARDAEGILRAQRRLQRDLDGLRRELSTLLESETSPAVGAAVDELSARLGQVEATAALDRDMLRATQVAAQALPVTKTPKAKGARK